MTWRVIRQSTLARLQKEQLKSLFEFETWLFSLYKNPLSLYARFEQFEKQAVPKQLDSMVHFRIRLQPIAGPIP